MGLSLWRGRRASVWFLSTDGLERELEGRDEVRDVFDGAVLVLVPVVHFFEDVPLVLLELAQCVRFDLLNLVSLSLQLCVELLDELSLLRQSFLLLNDDGFFDFVALFRQVIEDLPLFLDSSILLGFQVAEVLVHLGYNRGKLIVQTLDAVGSLLSEQVFELAHPVIAALALVLLVLVLLAELVFEICVQVLKLLIVLELICFERIVNFLALVDSVLFDVLDLPVK